MSAKCDLCGCPDYEVVWNKAEREKQGKLRSVVIRKDGEIVQGRNVMCKRCGLVYVWPRMSKEELDKFYAEDYRKVYGGGHSMEAEKRHAHTAAEILHSTLCAPSVEFGEGMHKLLDIGCSTGELLVIIQNRWGRAHVKTFGIEPNIEHCEIANKKGLYSVGSVENCTIEDYNPGIKFDIITMLNALEHVISPTQVMQKIHSLLNDGGYVLICVPNLYNRTIHIPVDAFLSNAHLYNFSLDTLTELFHKCGFEWVKVIGVTEEMGDKIYLLGRKVDHSKETSLTITPEHIESTKSHLEVADWVYAWKEKISQMGFK